MNGNIFANVREFGLVSLVLMALAAPAIFASSNGIRPFDNAYLLTLSSQ